MSSPHPADAAEPAGAGGEPEGGEAACWLDRVCPQCDAVADGPPPARCPRCGAESRG
ncbi:hypothetical protein ABZ721_35485 [Streptomyces sp. NPDC006733]|uniref:hypothetical protein n=1 Tax=Streptomyces sp. NPDC006733 TaxID=3155460 RepID=UPI0033E582A6